MNTRWLNDEELAAWVVLASALEALPGLLDSQLRRDAGLSHFDYRVLAGLSETPGHAMRLSSMAQATQATLPRLSHVIDRLENRGYLRRTSCPEDRRATMAQLTEEGLQKVQEAAPGHVEAVRKNVLDGLTREQILQLREIFEPIVRRLDPHGEANWTTGRQAQRND